MSAKKRYRKRSKRLSSKSKKSSRVPRKTSRSKSYRRTPSKTSRSKSYRRTPSKTSRSKSYRRNRNTTKSKASKRIRKTVRSRNKKNLNLRNVSRKLMSVNAVTKPTRIRKSKDLSSASAKLMSVNAFKSSGGKTRKLKSQINEDSLKAISGVINETQTKVASTIVKSSKINKLKKYVTLVLATNKLKFGSKSRRKTPKNDENILHKISVLTKQLNETIYHSYVEISSEYENIFTTIFGKSKKVTILARLILFIIILSATYVYIPDFLRLIRVVLKLIDKLIEVILMLIPEKSIDTSSDLVVFAQGNSTAVAINDRVTNIILFASKGTGSGMIMATQGVINLITALSQEGPETAVGGMAIITIVLLKAFKTMYRII